MQSVLQSRFGVGVRARTSSACAYYCCILIYYTWYSAVSPATSSRLVAFWRTICVLRQGMAPACFWHKHERAPLNPQVLLNCDLFVSSLCEEATELSPSSTINLSSSHASQCSRPRVRSSCCSKVVRLRDKKKRPSNSIRNHTIACARSTAVAVWHLWWVTLCTFSGTLQLYRRKESRLCYFSYSVFVRLFGASRIKIISIPNWQKSASPEIIEDHQLWTQKVLTWFHYAKMVYDCTRL